MPDSMIPFHDLKTQYEALKADVHIRIERVLEHGQFIMGPEVPELEERLADYVGVKHCIAASSGTDTLLIALMALEVGAGDEVITTPFTFIATGETIALLGAKPVFVDIDPLNYNLDPAKIAAAITPRTRAIMPVSLYGQCADMNAINAIAAKHGLPVIEDGAQSFGATYGGRRSCGLSTIGSTSFFPSKPLGCYGDGGALFTDDDGLAKVMREIRVHGQDRRYHHSRIGINGRLDTLQAAVLLAKLERFDWEVTQRQVAGERYSSLLQSSNTPSIAAPSSCVTVQESEISLPAINPPPQIVTPWIAPDCTSVYAQYTVRLEHRDDVIARMKESGIPTAIHYPCPLHLQPAFIRHGYSAGDFPQAEQAAARVVSLPMGPDLDVRTQGRVASALIAAVSRNA